MTTSPAPAPAPSGEQLAKRIAQFENMAQADAANEMAHFSLGRAYSEASRWQDAADSFLRCIQLAPTMSMAYQMAGEMLLKSGVTERAVDVLTDGYTVAAERGEFKPKKAIADLLKSIGRPLPEVAGPAGAAFGDAESEGPVAEGMIRCRQSGRTGTKMTRPPFKGSIGLWILANISHESFYKGWVPQGTKVINELRLDLSREKDQESYDQHMREYLGIDAEVLAAIDAKK